MNWNMCPACKSKRDLLLNNLGRERYCYVRQDILEGKKCLEGKRLSDPAHPTQRCDGQPNFYV